MAQTAAHLVDHVTLQVPVRQWMLIWVMRLPILLRLLLAAQSKLVTPVLQMVQRMITRQLLGKAALKPDDAVSGAVTLIQRFGSAANLNVHLHCVVLDGVYRRGADGRPAFVEAPAPTDEALQTVLLQIITRLTLAAHPLRVLVEADGSICMADNRLTTTAIRRVSGAVRKEEGRLKNLSSHRINPQYALPALDIDGLLPTQSTPIVEYLDETFAQVPVLSADRAGRARVRALAKITSADTHPLIVPRVRACLDTELGIAEPERLKWVRHWFDQGSQAIEARLKCSGMRRPLEAGLRHAICFKYKPQAPKTRLCTALVLRGRNRVCCPRRRVHRV